MKKRIFTVILVCCTFAAACDKKTENTADDGVMNNRELSPIIKRGKKKKIKLNMPTKIRKMNLKPIGLKKKAKEPTAGKKKAAPLKKKTDENTPGKAADVKKQTDKKQDRKIRKKKVPEKE